MPIMASSAQAAVRSPGQWLFKTVTGAIDRRQIVVARAVILPVDHGHLNVEGAAGSGMLRALNATGIACVESAAALQ
jgi:hypothetical protein